MAWLCQDCDGSMTLAWLQQQRPQFLPPPKGEEEIILSVSSHRIKLRKGIQHEISGNTVWDFTAVAICKPGG